MVIIFDLTSKNKRRAQWISLIQSKRSILSISENNVLSTMISEVVYDYDSVSLSVILHCNRRVRRCLAADNKEKKKSFSTTKFRKTIKRSNRLKKFVGGF